MDPLPQDPLTPASKGQLLAVGLSSLLAGTGLLVFAVWLASIAHASGRLGHPPVVLLLIVAVALGVGLLDIAFAILRPKVSRRERLLSNTALYLAGGFTAALPIVILVVAVFKESGADFLSGLQYLSMSGLGLLAIRLAHIRRKVS